MTGLSLGEKIGKVYFALPSVSRRELLRKGAGVAIAATVLQSAARADDSSSGTQAGNYAGGKGMQTMQTVTTKDGTEIDFKDWGKGKPVVFSHGWPLSADAWDAQMLFLGKRGFRVIAHDRRGHGRSGQPWNGNDLDTYADDLAQLMDTLDLHDVTLIGHSTGGGEVVRYLGKYGTSRVSKIITIGAIPPLMLKTDANPGGLPISAFDALRTGVADNRSQFFMDLTLPFYGYNKPGATPSPGIQASFLRQGLQMSIIGAYDCIKAFSETDLTEDLKKIDIPMLLLHGDADQIVPYADASVLAAKIVKNSVLKIYPGAPHGVATVNPDMVNADILAFIG